MTSGKIGRAHTNHKPVLLFHNCFSSAWMAEASDLPEKHAVTHHLLPKTPWSAHSCYSHTVSQDLHGQEKHQNCAGEMQQIQKRRPKERLVNATFYTSWMMTRSLWQLPERKLMELANSGEIRKAQQHCLLEQQIELGKANTSSQKSSWALKLSAFLNTASPFHEIFYL